MVPTRVSLHDRVDHTNQRIKLQPRHRLASIVATCKMGDEKPIAYIADMLRAILDGHPRSCIEELMPWHFRKASRLAA